jgi:uncharacterized membrane protein
MSTGHSHRVDDERRSDPPWARRLTLALLIPAVVVTALGMLLLWPRDVPAPPAAEEPRVSGEVVTVDPIPCPELPEDQEPSAGIARQCGTVTVRLFDGADAGEQVTTEIPAGPGAFKVVAGDNVVLVILEGADGPEYSIIDYQRSTQLWLLGAAFALAVIAFGRWRGLSALAGLVVTFTVLLSFIVPAILDGRSPLMVAIVGAAAIMLTVLYLTHGFNLATTVAVAGTLASLTLTAGLSALATAVIRLSGIADETSNFLTITQTDVNMRAYSWPASSSGRSVSSTTSPLPSRRPSPNSPRPILRTASAGYTVPPRVSAEPTSRGHQHDRVGLRRRIVTVDAAVRRRWHPGWPAAYQ